MKDTAMYEAFESAIRGGLAFVNKHYSEHKEGEVELLYVDVNNLYGWALTQPLPYADFKWIYDANELHSLIQLLPTMDCVTCSRCYFFEVDIEIPREHHNLMQQLPVAPEHMIPLLNFLANSRMCQTSVKNLLQHCCQRKII